ncbi:hypothetical protein [Streptomyces ochraceiscleroticus]|uniref:Uncharacterized protein n=1 Tax=Streptomyces ochraceiscleroticus TaxID=47761 RepID=A0ABW1MBS8_9ACTN|nr:hypothetical protein [Streptomyces ochraceiscleroticus]
MLPTGAPGLGPVPALEPLTYPGRPVTAPALLDGGTLLPLTAVPGPHRVGGWRLGPDPDRTLDDVLRARGLPPAGQRHPVLAVGSNACPAQVSYKLTRRDIPAAVPMVPVRLRGIGVGSSAHIGTPGYVAAAPFTDPHSEVTLVAGWLDAAQLAVVDATEAHYHRVLLPGDRFPMTLPSGERLSGAYLYVGRHGVLAGPDGGPRPAGPQPALLTELLSGSAALRRILGPGPEAWVARAAADSAVRSEARRIFRAEGRVLPQEEFAPYVDDGAEVRTYDDLPPIGGEAGLRRSPTRGD